MAFGDFTVVRASQKRVLGSSGTLVTYGNNEPAFEFNADGTYKGLLVEPAATNLLTYSEQFDNAAWTKGGLNTTGTPTWVNAGVAPDGSTTAEKMIATAVSEAHQITIGGFTVVASTVYTFSLYVKQAEYTKFYLGFEHGPSALDRNAIFNVNDGTVVSSSSGTTARIELAPNGYYRVSITGDTGATTSVTLVMRIVDGSNNLVFTGNDVDGILVWGAQLETGSVATSYIPTTGSTANRAADDISLSSASSLIGQAQGTIFVEVNFGNESDNCTLLSIDDGDVSDFITILKITGLQIRVSIRRASGAIANIITSSAVALGTHKIALGYENGDYALYIDGVSAGTSTNATDFPATTISRVVIADGASYGILNDNLRAVALSPTRLSNAQLASLTTL